MRIVGGAHRGRPLIAPAGDRTRPTTDRVREALFNILAHGTPVLPQGPMPQGARVLDLFAGSGALGLEALSRGAARALFVEMAAPARAAIRQNIETLSETGRTKIYRRDATKLGPLESNAGGPFDLVLMDPPYGRDLAAPALRAAREGGWLAPGAVIVLECAADEVFVSPEGFTLEDMRDYSQTRLRFLVFSG